MANKSKESWQSHSGALMKQSQRKELNNSIRKIDSQKLRSFLLANNDVKPFRKIYSIFLAIGFGLALGLVPIEVEGGDAILAYEVMFTNFQGGEAIENQLMNTFVAYALLALGTAIAFKAGVLNIGATGQFMTGGFLVLLLGIAEGKNFTTSEAIPTMIILSMLGGAAVATIAAVLKVFFRINEVVSTLLLNWVVFYAFKIVFVDLAKYRDDLNGGSKSIANTFTFDTDSGIQYLVPLILLIIVVVGAWLVLSFSAFGFKVKVCGKNFTAARANGINVNTVFISTFAISGALCGLAGAIFYVYREKVDLSSNTLPIEGFNAIAISLLAYNDPIGLVFTSLFYSIIEVGRPATNIAEIQPEAMELVVAIIIFFSALASIFLRFRPLKWIIEFIVVQVSKTYNFERRKKKECKTKIVKSEEYSELKKELKVIDQKLISMKKNVNEIKEEIDREEYFTYIDKLYQIKSNASLSNKNLTKTLVGNIKSKTELEELIWRKKKLMKYKKDENTFDPLMIRKREIEALIASYEIPFENIKSHMKIVKVESVNDWYKKQNNLTLAFMKGVA